MLIGHPPFGYTYKGDWWFDRLSDNRHDLFWIAHSQNITISNEQILEGYNMAEEKKLSVVGIFHSHPKSDPSPSSTDVQFMKGNPVPWVIYSGLTNDMKAYILESKVIQIPIN